MNKLERQQQDPRIQALRKLARSIPLAEVDSHAWSRIESGVIERLRVNRSLGWAWLSPVRGWAGVAALLVVVAAGAAWWQMARVHSENNIARCGLNVRGEVFVRSGKSDWRPLVSISQIRPGAVLRTAPQASLGVAFDSGTGFSLASASRLKLVRVQKHNQEYELEQGAVQVQLRRTMVAQSLVVRTRGARCEAIGTVFNVAYDSGNVERTRLDVLRGTVRMSVIGRPEMHRDACAPAALLASNGQIIEDINLTQVDSSVDTGLYADSAVPSLPAPALLPAIPMPVLTPAGVLELPPVGLPQSRVETSFEPVDTTETTIGIVPVLPSVTSAPPKAAPVQRVIDPAYVAGVLFGRRLFWRYDLVARDTVGWPEILNAAGLKDVQYRSPEVSAKAVREQGFKVIEIVKPTAAALAVLVELGYVVAVQSVWSVAVQGPWSGDDRTYIESNVAFSDHFWEKIVSGSVMPRAGRTAGGGWVARLYFEGAGYNTIDGALGVIAGKSPIEGTAGVEMVRSYERNEYIKTRNAVRLYIRCLMVVEADVTPESITKRVESRMDQLKLEISFKAPQLREIK